MTDTNTAQMVADLKATDDAVQAKGWVSPGLGVPGAPLGLLSTALNPLSGLAAAGLGWFTPLVSFLGDGLTQLQGGNEASVTSGSQDFDGAGRDLAGVADTYRQSTSAQTTEWSGDAASEYRDTGAQHADGIAGLGQASNTVGSAIIGAGQVVAQAIAEITELIAEAVAQIVPIMTQAIARAGETFGQSVVEAIPPCVGIAVEYALRIAAKLAALVASGDNLLKLVQGGMAVVELIQQALSSIGRQSTRPEADPRSGSAQSQGGGTASAAAAKDPGDLMPAGSSQGAGSPRSSTGGSGGGGTSTPTDAPASRVTPLDPGTYSSSVVPPSPSAAADAPRFSAHTVGAMPTGGGVPTGGGAAVGGGVAAGGGAAVGGVPLGAAGRGPATDARVGSGRGGDPARQESRQQPNPARAATPAGFPLAGMGAGRPNSEDKQHQRRYTVVENHEEPYEVSPAVIPTVTKKD